MTGASGFVGRHAVNVLAAAGHEVHAVSRTAHSTRGVCWHTCDLLDGPEVVAAVRPELLMHLAWYVEPADYLGSPENLAWVAASLGLLRAFVEAGGRRAVFSGTCAEYDWTPGGVLAEDAPIAPATVYGAAKDAVHRAGAAYARESGIELAWARLFFLFGPGEPPGRLVPAVAHGLLQGRAVETGSGAAVRDYLYVEDVARALAALLDSATAGAVNIGAGKGVVLRDLIELISSEVGRDDLLRIGARPDRPGEPSVLVADVSRLREEVGFTGSIGLEEGVARMIDEIRGQSSCARAANGR